MVAAPAADQDRVLVECRVAGLAHEQKEACVELWVRGLAEQ